MPCNRKQLVFSFGRVETKELGISYSLCAIGIVKCTDVVMKYHYLMCTELDYVYIGNKEKSSPLTGVLICFCLDN